MKRTALEIIMRAYALGLSPYYITKEAAKELAETILKESFENKANMDYIFSLINDLYKKKDKVSEYDVARLFYQDIEYGLEITEDYCNLKRS